MKLAGLKWKESSEPNRWYAHSSCGRKVFSVEETDKAGGHQWYDCYCDLTFLAGGWLTFVEAAIRRRNKELSK